MEERESKGDVMGKVHLNMKGGWGFKASQKVSKTLPHFLHNEDGKTR